jgi:hypothetical protein
MPGFATGFEGELRVKRNNQLLLPAWYYFLALFLLGFAFFPATRFFFVHTGRRWLYILVLAFSFSALTTPLCRMLAMRWGLVDNPSGHKIRFSWFFSATSHQWYLQFGVWSHFVCSYDPVWNWLAGRHPKLEGPP